MPPAPHQTNSPLNSEPIDAVITWVDGNDPRHIAKKKAVLGEKSRFSMSAIPGGRSRTRFMDNGELALCIYSIRKFAPWFRTIYVVTDDQCPDFLDIRTRQRLAVQIIDHKTIFRNHEWALPTFNSRTIETAIHLIPGLSSRYVYFNDDFVILQPTNADDFFSSNGVVLRGKWKNIQKFGPLRLSVSSLANHFAERVLGINRSMHILPQYRAAELAGLRDQFLEIPHVPYPVKKSSLEQYFSRNPDVFTENIRYRFRDMNQFVTNPLAAYLEIVSGRYTVSPRDDYLTICFNRHTPKKIREKTDLIESGNIRFLCLQGLEQAPPPAFQRVRSLLDSLVFDRPTANPLSPNDQRSPGGQSG
ncbi:MULTISPECIES: stealth family protein [unclassified Thioalkalivibrio]|uniref:stealth family protein n=1 Tax=unclassified Thioalkalivibrio TaxID=2621013 RepID=UPI0012DE79CB|nr:MULTISPECIES: stealth family protein [unclassified Thioalkalivibrio]